MKSDLSARVEEAFRVLGVPGVPGLVAETQSPRPRTDAPAGKPNHEYLDLCIFLVICQYVSKNIENVFMLKGIPSHSAN